jgi:hypothetical protein
MSRRRKNGRDPIYDSVGKFVQTSGHGIMNGFPTIPFLHEIVRGKMGKNGEKLFILPWRSKCAERTKHATP